MEETKGKLKAVFDALKQLNIQATPQNVSILSGVFSFLREIYADLEKNGGENDAGDPE